jgi:hypothetical protein
MYRVWLAWRTFRRREEKTMDGFSRFRTSLSVLWLLWMCLWRGYMLCVEKKRSEDYAMMWVWSRVRSQLNNQLHPFFHCFFQDEYGRGVLEKNPSTSVERPGLGYDLTCTDVSGIGYDVSYYAWILMMEGLTLDWRWPVELWQGRKCYQRWCGGYYGIEADHSYVSDVLMDKVDASVQVLNLRWSWDRFCSFLVVIPLITLETVPIVYIHRTLGFSFDYLLSSYFRRDRE